MFISLLIVNFLVAVLICAMVVLPFRGTLLKLLKRRFSEESAALWTRYLIFAIFTFSISIGTRVWDLEKLVFSTGGLVLTLDQAALEVYKTAIATLQINAILLFVILVFAWIASLIKSKP